MIGYLKGELLAHEQLSTGLIELILCTGGVGYIVTVSLDTFNELQKGVDKRTANEKTANIQNLDTQQENTQNPQAQDQNIKTAILNSTSEANPSSTKSINTHKNVELWTNMIVNDLGMFLYGFTKRSDIKVFNKLTAISKVGPKSAMAIMAMYNSAKLTQIVQSGDSKALAKVSGIGQKTAMTIIVALTGQLDEQVLDDLQTKDFAQLSNKVTAKFKTASEVLGNDVVIALQNLGFKPIQTKEIVQNVINEYANKTGNITDFTDDILRDSLKLLAPKNLTKLK